MAGQQPTNKIIRKNAHNGKWETIGAAWLKDDGESYSVSLELTKGAEKIKCLMVKNEPPKPHEASRMTHAAKTAPKDDLGGDNIPF